MGVDEGNLQVIHVEGILENCPITVLYIIYQCTVQYSTVSTIVYDSKCHRTKALGAF